MYQVITDEQSQPQIDALPPDALAPFAEARVVLEVAPWGRDSRGGDNPNAPMRSLAFGLAHQGLVTYLILERQRRVQSSKIGQPNPYWSEAMFNGHCVLWLPGSGRFIDPTVEQYPDVRDYGLGPILSCPAHP